MNRRDFGKTAFAVTVTALAAPAALGSAPHSVTDSIVIDFDKSQKRWVHLRTPDENGRNFEFLRDDGLIVGQSTTMGNWTQAYDAFENEFVHMYKPAGGKRYTHEEF